MTHTSTHHKSIFTNDWFAALKVKFDQYTLLQKQRKSFVLSGMLNVVFVDTGHTPTTRRIAQLKVAVINLHMQYMQVSELVVFT